MLRRPERNTLEGRIALSNYQTGAGPGDAAIDRIAVSAGDFLMLVARILIGGIFVYSGYGKLMNLGGFATSLASQGAPMPQILSVVGACCEFFGGLALVLGLFHRYAALLMIVFVIIATLLSHHFWDVAPAAQRGQIIQFIKNVAIIGGILMLFVHGEGRYALDRIFRRR